MQDSGLGLVSVAKGSFDEPHVTLTGLRIINCSWMVAASLALIAISGQ